MRVLHGAPLFKSKVRVYGTQHHGNKIAVGGNNRTFKITSRDFSEPPQGAAFGVIERLAAFHFIVPVFKREPKVMHQFIKGKPQIKRLEPPLSKIGIGLNIKASAIAKGPDCIQSPQVGA